MALEYDDYLTYKCMCSEYKQQKISNKLSDKKTSHIFVTE